jgi:hypothetical protein
MRIAAIDIGTNSIHMIVVQVRPDLSFDAATSQLLLAWTRTDTRIAFAQRDNAGSWSMPASSPLVPFTPFAPSMIGLNASGMPNHWVAWHGQGEFTSRRIFVQYTTAFPVWDNSGMGSVLGEWAISGPELGYVGVARQVLVSWTGIDTQQHLNVAVAIDVGRFGIPFLPLGSVRIEDGPDGLLSGARLVDDLVQ